jgi:hypothetical protein
MKDKTATATVYLPEIGGDVQIQLIPPKILREVGAKVTRRGRIDFNELMVWKLVYGVKDPGFTEAKAREFTRRCTLRILQPISDRIDALSGTDEHLSGGRGAPHSVRKLTEPMVMATLWLQRSLTSPPGSRTGARPRGGGRPAFRGASARSSAKSGDSGDDGVGDESEPPPAGRLCECGCGQGIAHRAAQALYLNDQHGSQPPHARAADLRRRYAAGPRRERASMGTG